MSPRVLVVDDHPTARSALRLLLANEPVEICGEAKNGKQAVQRVSELHPDVVILDLVMPEMGGIQAAYEIRRVAPGTKFLYMSIYDSTITRHANLLGPFVPKSALGDELIPALRTLIQPPNRLEA